MPRLSSVVEEPLQYRGTSRASLLACTFLIATCCKILLFPSYRSTDFNVHRHWKAVTRHLAMQDWYFDNLHVSTRHTLDYPPGFAFFESCWSNNGITNWLLHNNILDATCLQLLDDDEQDEAISDRCVAFMRSTVIVADWILWIGAWAIASVCGKSNFSIAAFLLAVLHPGLLWLDHVHFQYNGFLLGVWLLSLACLMAANKETEQGKHTTRSDRLHLLGAALFAILLTMKHLYLTLSLWYFSYLLRRYCFVQNRFSIARFLQLGIVTSYCLLAPFVPIVMQSPEPKQLLAQIFSRLFPFQRGLVHDYWAGNIWAIYMGANKFAKLFLKQSLPEITPLFVATLLFVLLWMGAKAAWRAAMLRDNNLLLLSMTFTALASFMTAYHVHEKAIMTALLSMVFLAAIDKRYSLLLWEMTAWGLLGLFPLLFEPRELLLKVTTYIAYMAALFMLVDTDSLLTQTLTLVSMLVIVSVFVVLEVLPTSFWGRMEFLPLALTSLACAVGLLQCFLRLTYQMLIYEETSTIKQSSKAPSVAERTAEQDKINDDDDDDVYVAPVRIVHEEDDIQQYPYLLSKPEMQQVAANVLPHGVTHCPWKRLYRLSRDGDALPAFLDSVKGHACTLLIIRTTKNARLGVFADATWKTAPRFVADGHRTCLFKVLVDDDDGDGGSVVKHYRWSGVNRYIQLCDGQNQRLAFGGGSDDLGQCAFGLSIERNFQVGTSERCVTFNNEPLCDERTFAIEEMEVFGFLVGQFS